MEYRNINDLTAIVTGGTRGIGLGIAESLVIRGASVAVTYRNNEKDAQAAREKLESLLSEGQQVHILKVDNSDAKSVVKQCRSVKEAMGPVNVLVNNAGIMPIRSFDEISTEDWNETIGINLNGAFYWCSAVVPDMKAQAFGRIVNIASIAARGGGVIGPHYAASKAGMLGLTRYAAGELGSFGITVNAIAPAFIEDAGPFLVWSREKKESLRETVSVTRLGSVRDVVRAFEYLLDSPFVTGVTLDVNGGTFMI
jgi:3-oxoacyl-[acyl-carrier protein] reductase